MKRARLAIIGLGKLGSACLKAIIKSDQFIPAGVVRRPEHVEEERLAEFNNIAVVAHISELTQVDAALVCVPAEHVLGAAHDLMQRGIPVIECAELHGAAFEEHKRELDRIAIHHKVSAIVGAGWDPGALSLFRGLFSLLTPQGHTEITHRPGHSLHHTAVARAIPGVKEALSTELRASNGKQQRYIYVELEEGAQFEAVESAIRNDPLFIDEETFIFPVDSVASLEEEGHGVLMERRGTAAAAGHQLFLLEARFSETALAAEVMLAAAHALKTHRGRAYSLLDLPLGAFWGELREQVERQVI
jgi:diaminopimelate dehydrogenase